MKFIRKLHGLICGIGCILKPFFLLALRLVWGLAFLWSGYGKFGDIENVSAFFGSLGIPLPLLSAYLVATVEMVGGGLLVIGLFSRFAAFFLAVNMITAYCTAHMSAVQSYIANLSDPSLISNETPFPYLITALVVLCFGPGLISLDWLICKLWYRGK